MKQYSIPRNIWRIIYPLLIYLGIMFVTIFIFAVAITVAVGDENFEYYYFGATTWMTLVTHVLSFIIFALIWRKERVKLPRFENNKLNTVKILAVIFISIGVCYALSLLSVITGFYRHIGTYEEIVEQLFDAPIALQFILLVIVAPVMEEIMYRGVIFNRLNSWMPTWVAVLISSALFGVMHLNFYQGVFAFLAGILFCVLYVRYRNMWIAIIAHAAFNLAAWIFNMATEAGAYIPTTLLLFTSPVVVLFFALVIKKFTEPAYVATEISPQEFEAEAE